MCDSLAWSVIFTTLLWCWLRRKMKGKEVKKSYLRMHGAFPRAADSTRATFVSTGSILAK